MDFADGDRLPVDVVVFATGVRPRDELAREAGLDVGERGGVVVDDACRTAVPDVFAIGEVACIQGRTWGLVGPGYTMAEVVVDRILGGEATFPGADTSTKLKLLGVDVASFGDVFAAERRAASRSCTPTRWPASTRSSCSATTRRRCSAACSSATPRRTPRSGRWSAARSAATRPPGCCPRAAEAPRGGDLPDSAGRLLLQQRHRRHDPRRRHRARLHRPGRGEGVQQGRHLLRLLPAAGQAADDRGAGEAGADGQQRALRALRPLAGPSSSTSSG